MVQILLNSICLILGTAFTNASLLNLDIYYPESGLDSASIQTLDGNIFSLGYSSLPYDLELVNQYMGMDMYYFPWFGNYTLFVNNETHYQGPDHWRLTIDLGEFSGDLYVLISANFYGNTIIACEAIYSLGTCQPRRSPYLVTVSPSTTIADLTIYPAFGTSGVGDTRVMFEDFFSVTLNNYRDITVHVPWSVIENPLRRTVGALVLLDGDFPTTSLMASQGGLDAAILNGALPEVLIVGVPPALNGSACPNPLTDGCSQRSYELTPTECDSSVSICQEGQTYGGASVFLQFVWEEVLVAVFTELQLTRGEVSITGYSFGGLTSCYAASSRPTQYRRAFCMSPSVWWNAGEMEDIIEANYEANSSLPAAVVIEVGTQEGPSIISSNYEPQEWMVYIQDMVSAWRDVGLGKTDSSSLGEESYPSTSSNLIFYTTAGGVHNTISWVDTIDYGLPLMYQTEYPEKNIIQRNARTEWEYPEVSGVLDDSDDCDSSNMSWTVIVIVILVLLLPMNVYMLYCVLLKCFGKDKAGKELENTLL